MIRSRNLLAVLALVGVAFGAGATVRASDTTQAADDPWSMRSHETTWTVQTGPGESTGASAQWVFPPDDRVLVTDTTQWPFRLVTHIVMLDEALEPLAECSGMMLSPNSVLTAAHCVFDFETQEYFPALLFVPGETPFSEPYGFAAGVEVAIPNGYADTGAEKFDVAIVKVEGTGFQPQGPFAVIAGAPNGYLFGGDTVFFSAGYPGDKPLASQWLTAAPVEEVDFDFIYTSMDAYPGQSGSPVFTYNFASLEAYVVGVFSFETPLFNGAVRFNPVVIEALHDYCNLIGCSFESVMLSERTPTVSPTATFTPTKTPTPTATPTPTPIPTPSPGTSPVFQFRLRAQQLARDGVH